MKETHEQFQSETYQFFLKQMMYRYFNKIYNYLCTYQLSYLARLSSWAANL